MSFNPSPVRAIRSALTLIALAATLSACVMRTVAPPPALPCPALVKASGLLDQTPGTTLPPDDSKGAWVAFADRQTGQLDKANADKAGAARLLDLCDRLQSETDAKVRGKRSLRLF